MTAAFSRRRPWKGLAVGVTLLLGATACTGSGSDDAPIIAPTSSTSTTTPAPTTTSTAPKVTYPMTGMPASSAAAAARPTVAVPVRLSGSGHARGLQVADLVYVSFPNSSSVRALALFQSATSALVGPVAQTRPVDAKVLPVANAGLVYDSGASGYVKRLDKLHVPQLSRAETPSAFSGASTSPLISLARARRIPRLAAPRRGLINIDAAAKPATAARTVTIAIPGRSTVRLTWSPSAKLWRGNLSGLALSARNVVVQTTAYTYDIVPHSGKITEGNPDVFGQGTAVSMPAGRVLGGSWSLAGPKAATGYVDATKRAVPFAAGSTWVIFVPKGTRVR